MFVTNNKRCKIKEEEIRGIIEEYGKVKSLKLGFHPNNTRNEAMICFSAEEEAQLAITKINTYEIWSGEPYKPIRKSGDFKRETEKPDNSNKEHKQRKNNESSTKQVELSYFKEEMKYIKGTLDILLKGQWIETLKDSKGDSTDITNQKIKQKLIKNTETNRAQTINSNK